MNAQRPSDAAMAAVVLSKAELHARRALRPAIESDGVAALRRLVPIAQGDTGQSGRIARFLLGLYNGTRFPFDLTDLRGLDYQLHDDCLAVLRMDHTPALEVHLYFDNGGQIFETLARSWSPHSAPQEDA